MTDSYLATPEIYRHIAVARYGEVSHLISHDNHIKMMARLREHDEQVYLYSMWQRIKNVDNYNCGCDDMIYIKGR